VAEKRTGRLIRWLAPAALVSFTLGLAPPAQAQVPAAGARARVARAVAFDVSPPLRDIAAAALAPREPSQTATDPGPIPTTTSFSGDGALQSVYPSAAGLASPEVTFEGLANSDNARLVSPPDPVGDVGPDDYVEMVNISFAVYSKTGARRLGPIPLGALWTGFSVADCGRSDGDPVVRHDHMADRWVLTQFTSNGPEYFNCLAISTTADPTGSYFRYAFSTGLNFPDYPKYGIWGDAYFISTREFFGDAFAGIGAYALERDRMLQGDPDARVVSVLVPPGSTPWLLGDGLLPADLDGSVAPPAGSPNYFVGTMNRAAGRGAPFDAINIFQFSLRWGSAPSGEFSLAAQLPVAEFDSLFPCAPASRNCIPQPETDNKVDILSYRQRPTWRLAYRNFGAFESLVTNQSVQARPGVAGVRWYEIRRANGQFSVHQQGTYAPGDGIHRWMASVAMDRQGNMALGYSVSNAIDVYPGIRYTGRLNGDSLHQMTLGEGVIVNGGGSQNDSARWGDYTSMNIDPNDDCTFWYVNQYYQVSSDRGWQTRIGAFRLPGC
jgi:hypothetical protein